MSQFNRRPAKLVPEHPPLTPSQDNEPSPLDVLRQEVATLKAEIARLRKEQAWKTDQRVLDLQLKMRDRKKFLEEKGLLAEFHQRFPF